jgi:NitT/TauT family transport system substrate-binding protein
MVHARSRALAPLAAMAVIAVAGCSGLIGTSSGATSGQMSETTLNVAVVPAADSAGFFVALHQGLFAAQGLTIHYTPATSSNTVIGTQMRGGYDITAGNYVSYIQAVVAQHDPLQVIAEGSVMQQGAQAIYTMPDSKIKSLRQLKGHVLGINAPKNINYLLAASVLTENGINPSSVAFPKNPIPFPDMAGELASGKIDAAALPEPFASLAELQYGAVTLTDMNQGATQDFPILGYVATKSWVQQHPAALRAFLTALRQGQQIADTDRGAIERAMETLNGPQNGQVTPIIAAVMALDQYPLSIDPTRLQRVPDVMFQFGLLRQRFSISQMLGG